MLNLSSLLVIHFKNIFLLCIFHFTLLMVYFNNKKFLIFNLVQLPIISFKCFLYTVSEVFPYTKVMQPISYISSRISIILTFILRSKIYLELIFVCDMRYVIWGQFSPTPTTMRIFNLPSTLWKIKNLPRCCAVLPLSLIHI